MDFTGFSKLSDCSLSFTSEQTALPRTYSGSLRQNTNESSTLCSVLYLQAVKPHILIKESDNGMGLLARYNNRVQTTRVTSSLCGSEEIMKNVDLWPLEALTPEKLPCGSFLE